MSRLLVGLLGLSLYVLIACLTPSWGQDGTLTEEKSIASHTVSAPPLETVVARKAAVQARLDALGPPPPDNDPHAEMRSLLEQLLATLTGLEEALSKQVTLTTQTGKIPQRLKELGAESARLETQPSQTFTNPTDQLRDEYQTKLQAAQTQVQDLLKDLAIGEVRLVNIPKELEQHHKARLQFENELKDAPPSIGLGEEQTLQVELLKTHLQLELATTASLEAERQWLLKRVPLQDLRLRVARLQQRNLQNDLNTIKRSLGQAIEQEQAALAESATEINSSLQLNPDDPLEALLLGVSLENVEIRQRIAADRQQLNTLSDAILGQEQRTAKATLLIDRLNTQAEKYVGDEYLSGEVASQQVLALFERLRQIRSQYQETTVTELEKRLRSLNERLFALDEQLFDFAETIKAQLAVYVAASEPDSRVAQIRTLFVEQETLLREQQQVLSELVQSMTGLIAAHREYRRQLDDGYVSALTKLFWVRTSEPLSLGVMSEMGKGAVVTFKRLSGFIQEQFVSLKASLPLVHLLVLSLLGLLLAVIVWVRRRLRKRILLVLDSQAKDDQLPGREAFMLVVLRAATWPAYILLLAFVPEMLGHTTDPTVQVIVNGLLLSAGIVWISLLSRGLLQSSGWARISWELSPALCRSLQRSIQTLCVALLVFIVPRYIVLALSGEADTTASSFAFARLLFMAFQLVVLIVVGLLARRGSLLMQTLLAHSRQGDGVMWRLWPFVHILVLMGLSSILVLDIFGYRYAALSLWLRTVESLSVVLVVRGLAVAFVLYVLQRLVDAVLRVSRPAASNSGDAGQVQVDKLAGVRFVIKTVLTVCAAGIILEVWGFPIRWLITGESAVQLVTRTALIGLAVFGGLIIVQMSNVITSYFLQPRTNWRGQRREAGRQLKTLIPLIQAVISVVVIFVTALVILEQIGIDTAPLLAGVGIFGLAVGFASQSLIKDVINGLFILFEDSISLGDIVELRGVAGEVEKFTLRAVTLRDLSGNVHVIPNSAFDMVTNMTKTFSRYLLDVGVAYRENVDEVIDILREIDAGMRQDPTFGQWILEPIDILGLDRFEDSAVVIRARLITRPVKQWEVGREFKRRMKAVFDQRGIEIPFPHQTIYWGQPKDGNPLPLHLVTSGASRPPSQERVEEARNNAPMPPFEQEANGHDAEAKTKT